MEILVGKLPYHFLLLPHSSLIYAGVVFVVWVVPVVFL